MGCGIGFEGKGSELGSFRATISDDFLLECAIYVLLWVNNNNPGIKFERERERKKRNLERERFEFTVPLLVN